MADREPSEEAITAFRDWVESYEWTFAKSYADGAPHEWLVRRNVHNEEMFEAFIGFIRFYGYPELYAGEEYVCLDIGNHKYWTMGAPVEETVIINRRSYDGYDIVQELVDLNEDPAEWLPEGEYNHGELYYPAEGEPDNEPAESQAPHWYQTEEA